MTSANPSRKPFVLAVLDGLGNNPNPRGNAVLAARKPVLDKLLATYPTTEIITCGKRVGLPDGQMGNSEVGHMNIGAGRVVMQELTRINDAVAEKSFGKVPVLQELFASMRAQPKAVLHFIGLVSTGGVHSHQDHLQALLLAAAEANVPSVSVHVITDGRDRPPTDSPKEVGELVDFIAQLRKRFPACDIRITSIVGRYFAMDRDKRWDRTAKAYDLLTQGLGETFTEVVPALQKRIDAGKQDEFLEPLALKVDPETRSPFIEDGDALMFFNFRTDRMRQLLSAFLGAKVGFDGFAKKRDPKLSRICTLTEYDARFPVDVCYKPFMVSNNFGEILSAQGLTQLRIAETEKYPHVTYFFNGGNEIANPGEERILVPSPRDVATYDLKPEMSAYGVTEKLLGFLESNSPDVIVVNFANCDMVGHTGSYEAAVKAVETVDTCLGRVLAAVESKGGSAIVTADHGNAEQMVDYVTGKPHTFHTLYPVPLVVMADKYKTAKLRTNGALCDIAPTALQMLGLPQPAEMTGKSLIIG